MITTAKKTNRIPEAPATSAAGATKVSISAPNMQTAEFTITGTTPYVQNKFSEKAKEMIMATQAAGSVAKSKKTREAKDFDACFEGAKHISHEGWCGIPAPAFRAAMISACRMVGFKMTHAKLSVFVQADGFDAGDGTPLVKITKGTPIKHVATVRNDSGVCDIRARPMWREGWQAKVRVSWDGDQFTLQDVTNLLSRAGMQVGIGEGRNDSRNSAGMGWGAFTIAGK